MISSVSRARRLLIKRLNKEGKRAIGGGGTADRGLMFQFRRFVGQRRMSAVQFNMDME